MTLHRIFARIAAQEDLNFLLTNRIPRTFLTRLFGWFSRIEQPLVRDLSIAAWQRFAELNLAEAKQSRFRSLHECFTRELKTGARSFAAAPNVLCSPSDGIVGACGRIEGTTLIQAKGFPYTLMDLLAEPALVEAYRDGTYVTLRLSASMYHRFHAPHDCRIERIAYISGDTWNVNPIALARVEKLFCKNERAVIRCRLDAGGALVTLVPVAAVLVAGIRLHCADVLLHLRYRGPNEIPCDAHVRKGAEMGWFQHGSTIIVFAPRGFELCAGIRSGVLLRAGEPLMVLPPGGGTCGDHLMGLPDGTT